MRVLLVHNHYRSAQPSGEDVVVAQECDALRKAGHDVEVYRRRSDDIAQMSRRDKAMVPARVVWSAADGRGVVERARATGAEVVHVHNTFPLISAAGVVAARRAGLPVVATLHNFRLACAAGTLLRDGRHCHDCLEGGPWPALRHRCYRGSIVATAPLAASIATHRGLRTWERSVDVFVSMSVFARDLMARAGIPAAATVVKPHHVSQPPRVRTGAGDYGLFMGRLSEEKGPDLLLDAWLPEMGRLVVVGDGPLRMTLQDAATRRGLDVDFRGALPREEARTVVAGARFLAMTSRFYETFGMSAVEAMSAGVPVVAPDMGVLPEVVTAGVTGELYRFGDREDLRRAIGVLADPATSQQRGAAAREEYLRLYTADRSVARLEEIYAEATRRCAARGR